MKTIDLTIPRTSVESAVAEATAYTGAKATDRDGQEAVFERVATADRDRNMIRRLVNEGFLEATERFRQFVTSSDFSGETLKVTMEVSDSYDTATTERARSTLESFLSAHATARWLRFAFPAKAEEWEKEAAERLSELEANLFHRPRPRRKH